MDITNMKDMYNKIYSRDNPSDMPHGWIQWKGTNVCMDIHCECGAFMHFDGDFFYNFECPHCNRKYAVGQVVKLIELTDEEYEAKKDHDIWKTVEPDEDKDIIK